MELLQLLSVVNMRGDLPRSDTRRQSTKFRIDKTTLTSILSSVLSCLAPHASERFPNIQKSWRKTALHARRYGNEPNAWGGKTAKVACLLI